MTAMPQPPVFRSISHLVAACAPSLGFMPHDCLVGFVHGVPGRDGPVVTRVDLGDAEESPAIAEALAIGIDGTRGRAVDLVAWVDAPDHARRDDLPGADLLGALIQRLTDAGIDIIECITTNGRVWWSSACGSPHCCPPESRALDSAEITAVQAEYVYAGLAPLASREELAARVACDEARAREVGRFLRSTRRPARIEPWRDQHISLVSRLLVPGARRGPAAGTGRGLSDARTVARVLRALADIRVRDTVLLRLIKSAPEPPDRERDADAVAAWCSLLRAAPSGHVAPAGSILALLAWWRGAGALANLALDRALADDPDYRLARLAGEVMSRGVDPRAWRASMANLTEEECRGSGRL